MEPYELTASEASALIAGKKLSCEELARSTMARIEERDPVVKAWSYVDRDMVIRNARELDKTPPRSPLHGLTVGVKDIIDTADMPTQHNSALYLGHRPGQDAACVATVRHSGALLMGKTDTVEFAFRGRKAASRNPNNLAHTPGGSSSGSGAAVADKQVQLAFGTQTAGSVIRPAAFNGIYGMKPTYGAVSREGAKNASHTLDTIGWYGRSVDDLALLAKAYRLFGMETPSPVGLKGLKVGLCQSPVWEHADAHGRAAFFEAGRRLETAGATVVELTLPEPFNGMADAQNTILYGEARGALLHEYLGPKQHLLAEHYHEVIANLYKLTPEKMRAAYDLAAQCRMEFDALFASGVVDVVLTLASPGEAPEGLDFTGNPIFNSIWTLLHAPCVAIPVGKSARNLPLGIQLVGPRFSDDRVLEIARACAPALHEDNRLGLINPA